MNIPPPAGCLLRVNSRILQQLFCGLGLLLAAVSAVIHVPIGLDNDTLTITHQAQKLLDGGRPYVDFVDINPPFVYLVMAIPLIFSHLVNIPAYLALNLFGLAVGATSLLLAWRLLRGEAERLTICTALALALFFLSFMHQLFGDREYLMVALVMPLLLLYSPWVRREAVSRGWRISAAFMAAIGFALKPYAIHLYIAAMLYRLLRERSFRQFLREAEHYILAAAGVLYVFVMGIFFRDAFTGPFFEHYGLSMLPFSDNAYGAIHWSWGAKSQIIIQQLLGSYGVLAIAGTLILWLLAPKLYHQRITYLCFLLCGAIGSYAFSAGWYYTQYPFMVAAFLLLILAGGRLLSACQKLERIRKWLAIGLIIGAMLGSLWHHYGQPIMSQIRWDLRLMRERGHPIMATLPPPPVMAALNQALDQHPGFLWLGFRVWAPVLLDDAGERKSVGRFDYLWPLTALIRLRNDPSKQKEYAALLAWLAGAIADDIRRHQPEIIISDASPKIYGMPAGFQIIAQLAMDPKFSDIFKRYERSEQINLCQLMLRENCAYDIYTLRKPEE